MFIWLLVRGARANENSPRQTELRQATIKNLTAAEPQKLYEPAANSVTEFTTRSLEPVLRESKKQ